MIGVSVLTNSSFRNAPLGAGLENDVTQKRKAAALVPE
jgi:hypothetical protein